MFVDQEDHSDNENENDEADVLYYYNTTSSQQNIDALSDSGNQDIEKVNHNILIQFYTAEILMFYNINLKKNLSNFCIR